MQQLRFINNSLLNMFRASLCPSSGTLDRILLHTVFSTVKDKSE